MSLDQYTIEEMLAEMQRRRDMQAQGRCPYCHHTYDRPVCRYPDQHRAPTPAPLTSEQLRALGDGLLVVSARDVLALAQTVSQCAVIALVSTMLDLAPPPTAGAVANLVSLATKTLKAELEAQREAKP